MEENMDEKIKKANKIFLIIIVIILIAVIIGVVTCIIIEKNNNENGLGKEGKKYTSTLDMKEQAPLINMSNKENAEIEQGEKINSSQSLQEEKTVSGLKLTNIKLHTEKGLSYFNATVENTTQEDFEKKAVTLKFKKSNGKVLANVGAVIPTIKAGGKGIINASTTQDIVNAIDVEIEL